MVKQIAVENLPAGTTESEVKSLITKYGKITRVLMKPSRMGLTAYVDLSTDAEADSALAGLADARMGTVSLNVNEARPRQE